MQDTNKTSHLRIYNCGQSSYKDVLRLQHDMCRHRWQGKIGNTILIAEHPPVITLGARDKDNKLLVDEKQIKDNGIEVKHVRRGGAATAHNPGQLVIYPILELKSLNLGVNEYIRELEAIGIELLEHFGVHAQRREGYPGLWVQERKIGSIGVQVQHWCTLHGMAINFQNDLEIFDYMVPCGLDGVQMTSVKKETGKKIRMDEAKDRIADLCRGHWSNETE